MATGIALTPVILSRADGEGPRPDRLRSFAPLRRTTERGFTLTEILVTTAIFAIIMIAALTVYDRSNQVFKTSAEAADLQQSTRIGFDKLVSDLRMAGFDYNRGGEPTGEGQVSQPDEQIEYAGPAAVIFRANFNYNVAASAGNGLELSYEPKNITDQPIFPYVTTSNDEIIAYVLRSNDASKNTSSISFYVDDYVPRAAFPSTISPAPKAGNPSHPEETVTISGIDTTNANPPYTLYRMTVSDVKNGNTGTPVAENIRSLEFMYYMDLAGTKLLTEADGTTPITQGRNAGGGTFNATGTGAIGGDGQYAPDSPGTTSNFTDRSQRALITSVRVKLVGMNANQDLGGYTVPTETISAVKNYRQYALESLVVPRNLGLTGFPEPNYNAPAPPTIVDMCVGHCGAPVIYWTPPTSAGDVTKYRVEWDSVQTGAFANGVDITDPNATSAIIPDDGVSDVSQTRWYHILAYNDNGASIPSTPYSIIPQNKTKPRAPAGLLGVTGQINQIPLSWTAPTDNVSGKDLLACTGAGGSSSGSAIPPQGQEIVKFRVVRGTTSNFDPTDATNAIRVLNVSSASQPASALPGAIVNWNDTGASNISAAPPANCTQYYYRVQAVDRCSKQNNWNVSNDPLDSTSDWFPAAGNAALGPYQSTYAGAAPTVAPALNIDRTPSQSGCPDPSAMMSNNCRITIQWQKSINDTATPPNPIGVDWYVITRESRVQGSNGTFQPDTGFGANAQRQVNCSSGICTSGYSQSSPGSLAKFVDTPPMFLNGNSGPVLEYRYTVGAKNCSLYSGNAPNDIAAGALPPNPQVIYPGCSVNPTIVQQAGTNANALSGDSPQQAWAFNGGDFVQVTPAQGTTVTSVDFDLSMWPQGTAVGTTTNVPAPGNAAHVPPPGFDYDYGWTDQIDNQIYALRITIHTIDAQGGPCNEVRVKYIRDLQAAACFIGNVTPPSPVIVTHPANPETDHIDFTVLNSGGGDALKFNNTAVTPAFHSSAVVTWKSPDLPNHTDLALTSLVWTGPGIGSGVTDTICTFGSNCATAGIGVNSIISVGTVATVTTSSAHALAAGDKVTIQGATQSAYNGTFTVQTVINSTSFTYSLASALTGTATGTKTMTAFRKTTRTAPSGLQDVTAGSSFTLRLNFSFDGHGNLPSLPSTPSAIDSICISYQIAGEPGVTKFCNLVGTTANNPGACN